MGVVISSFVSPSTPRSHPQKDNDYSVEPKIALEFHQSSAESVYADRLIQEAVEARIAAIDTRTCGPGEEESFFVADLGHVYRQHIRWKQKLPNIKPFYAVKCNSDPQLLRLLATLGTGFDCASIVEMQLVLSLGVEPSRIIFANPCKVASSISFARRAGVQMMTFDNEEELYKIKDLYPGAQLLLRIYASDPTALVSFGDKYGASPKSTSKLLTLAWKLDLDVAGVSFHIGTGASDPNAMRTAVKHAKNAFIQAERIGYSPRILDIGGGFKDSSFELMSTAVSDSIASTFPSSVRVIGEPGRFYAMSGYTLTCNVIARRRHTDSVNSSHPTMLYQNDGVYGNFMNALIEKEVFMPVWITQSRNASVSDTKRAIGKHKFSIWGPTCDSTDCVTRSCILESEVKIGDWLSYRNMGAYTISTSTRFNGFTDKHDVVYVCSEPSIAHLVRFD